jgi:small subunit ribosomal protein S8
MGGKMVAKDIIADNINKIKIYDKLGKPECTVLRSKLMVAILKVLKEHNYIEDFYEVWDNKQGIIKVKLKKAINEIGVIKPRFSVKKNEWHEKEALYLPAYNIGHLIVSTSKGVMTNVEAKKLGIGGKLLAYVY